ncbi:pyruvate, water dikinase regulatory protein [Lichenicoccus sp.]|uniref:pyruvate, water dikinase regulatory protein n=1 Tax=Lichenicoccus sp. TaxID=2781899 RepID=UPI003D153181
MPEAGAPRAESADEHRISLHLVSDATGETLNAIARASVAQFQHTHVVYHRWNLIRTRLHLHRVLQGIEADPGPVLSSVIDQKLRSALDLACKQLQLQVVNVLDPVLTMLQETLGEAVQGRPGIQYVLDDDYYKRIDAMHYVLAHDDGQAVAGLREADVVLVGVSRASKTPTSFYLANRGVKAANVPLVPGVPVAPELLSLRRPVVGLTIDPRTLIEIRRHRLRALTPGGTMGGIKEDDNIYVDPEAVRDEVVWARRLCARNGWPVIDVSRRSIEETSAAVIELAEAWNLRHAAAPAR